MAEQLEKLLSRFSFSDVVTLFGIACGFAIYWLQRQRKALSYRVIDVKVVTPYDFANPEPPRDDVSIAIENTGNVPLLAGDFVSPIEVSFLHGGEIVRSEVRRSAVSDDVHSQVSHLGRLGLVQFDLLNPREIIRATFRVERFSGDVRVTARIVGVQSLGNSALRGALWMHGANLTALYIGYVLTRFRAREPVDQYFFVVLALPYTLFAIRQVAQIVRQQCLKWAFRPFGDR